MSIFKKILGKHKIMVFVPRRGGRKLLFTTFVNDIDRIEENVLSELEKYSDDVELKQYKYIIALDTKTNTEVKINNPYFDESTVQETKKTSSKQELFESMQIDMAATIHEAYKQMIPSLISSMTQTMVNVVKDTVTTLIEQKQSSSQWKDIAMLISSIVELARNWDKVKVMSNEIAPMIKQYIETGKLPIQQGDKK